MGYLYYNSLIHSFLQKNYGYYTLLNYKFKGNYWKFKNYKNHNSFVDFPLWRRIDLELHSNCNRNCFFCPRFTDRTGIRKDQNGKKINKKMPTWKVFDILDQAADLDYTGIVTFHRLSEPFLDKRILKVIKYANNKGLFTWEFTNGDVLKKDPLLCKNIDGVLKNITIGLYDYKSEKEKKEQIKFWNNRFNKTKVYFSLAAEFPLIRQNAKLYNDKLERKQKTRKYPCFRTRELLIRYDGEVSLCCQDDQCNFRLGNVFNNSLKELWWSKKHIDIVNSLKQPGGRNQYSLCSNCLVVGKVR
jgi:radical SAM protein with 4Fe4S-binding SPASM domain